MKLILKDNNTYVLSCKKGEELMEGIKEFCREEHIEAASFSAIGATNEVELAWYDLVAKKYVTTLLKEDMEIVSLNGNVSKMGDDLIIHNHGVLSFQDMSTKAGHVMKVMISGACEVILTRLKGKIDRAYDEDTGLNLME